MRKYSVLLVDDEELIRRTIGLDLSEQGYEVAVAETGEQAIDKLRERSFDVVIADLVMEGMGGLGVLREARGLYPEIMAMVLTGYGNLGSAIEAIRLGAADYLLKPCEPAELHFRVARCVERLDAVRKIRVYERVLPVCSACKKIRDDDGKTWGSGEWVEMEDYLWRKAQLEITSIYCPDCKRKLYQELADVRRRLRRPSEEPHDQR